MKNQTSYKIIFDDGKPHETIVNGERALKRVLKEFYQKNAHTDYPYDAHVYNSEGDDITESQFIEEMVGKFLP